MLLYLRDTKKPKAYWELKNKVTSFQRLQIANRNEKLGTILTQANLSQSLRQTISNTHCGFQSSACIITERLDNIKKINLSIIAGRD